MYPIVTTVLNCYNFGDDETNVENNHGSGEFSGDYLSSKQLF
jgi:hypothetical protein